MKKTAERFMGFPRLHKEDFEVSGEGSIAVIKFDGRYPEKDGIKTRNRGSEMWFEPLIGEVELLLLDGQGSFKLYVPGKIAHIPRDVWYVWVARNSVAGIASNDRVWRKEDQQQIQMSDQELALFEHLQRKGS